MVYELERDGESVYCNSTGIVSALLAKGWTLKDSGHAAMFVREVAARSSSSRKDPSRMPIQSLPR